MSSRRSVCAAHRAVVYALVLVILFLVALFLRSYFALDRCFLPGFVNFQETDPYYHVRAIEHLVDNFPHPLKWDPYALHPGGQYVAMAPFLDWTAAALALILGAGTPSLALIHATCAWLPAVWGALTIVPVYFLGVILRNARVGLLAAATLAVLPGPFLKRTSLGYVDHHIAETFLSLLTVLFLLGILGTCSSKGNTKGSGASLSNGDWWHRRGLTATLCGLSLGCYLLSWIGGSLLVLFLFVALTIYLAVEFVRSRSVHWSCFRVAIAWTIALLMVIPFRDVPGFSYHVVALLGSGLYIITASGMAWVIERRRGRRAIFPIGLMLLAIVGLIGFRLMAAGIFDEVLRSISRFASGAAGTFIIEARPLLYEGDSFSLRPAFAMFQTAAVAAVLGAGLLAYRVFRNSAPGGVIFAVWTIGVVVATLVQERFAYYLVVNVAVLSGYFWSALLDLSARGSAQRSPRRQWMWTAVAYVIFFTIGLYPSASAAYAFARQPVGPHKDWLEAMSWLRQHSPEPFNDPKFFAQRYDQFAIHGEATKPRAKYSVMCSWDHGYWVTGMARRVPTANPTQSGLGTSAVFFAAQSEEDAARILMQLDARYVVVDETLPVWPSAVTNRFEGTFGTIARLAGFEESELCELTFAPNDDGTFKPIILFYPEYYRSMLNRLYLFGAQGYDPQGSTWAVRTSTFMTIDGHRFKRIDAAQRFMAYEPALEFIDKRRKEGWRIVGMSPTESCVPLEPLRQFQRVYQSPTKAVLPNVRRMSAVEIFEFTPSMN